MDNFFLTLYSKCVIWLFVKEILMKTGDVVLYAKNGKVCVGVVGIRWKDRKWNVRSMRHGELVVKRQEKFLTPIKEVKKYLDISNKI